MPNRLIGYWNKNILFATGNKIYNFNVAAAMSDYHKQSKIVKPKLRLLEIKTASLQDAESNLAAAEAELKET